MKMNAITNMCFRVSYRERNIALGPAKVCALVWSATGTPLHLTHGYLWVPASYTALYHTIIRRCQFRLFTGEIGIKVTNISCILYFWFEGRWNLE